MRLLGILRPLSGRNEEGKRGALSGRNGEGKRGALSGCKGEGEMGALRGCNEEREMGALSGCNEESEIGGLHSDLIAWPVYFFESDTSGEKSFEEFYTPGEDLDLDKFVNLGVVKNSKKRPVQEIDEIFVKLRKLFDNDSLTKADVVEVLKEYLPNFAHIETGKGLDQKM